MYATAPSIHFGQLVVLMSQPIQSSLEGGWLCVVVQQLSDKSSHSITDFHDLIELCGSLPMQLKLTQGRSATSPLGLRNGAHHTIYGSH
jgi:hypothetical protein